MKRHATDLVSLIFGLLFLLTAAWWYGAIYLDLDLNLPNIGWFLAGGLIVLGLIGVGASLRRDRGAADQGVADQALADDATTAELPADEDSTVGGPTAREE
jgi:hypothetical protein